MLSFRSRDRWVFRKLFERSQSWVTRVKTFDGQELPARKRVVHRFDADDEDVEKWLSDRQWLIVNTALRAYFTRIRDNRSLAAWKPADEEDLP